MKDLAESKNEILGVEAFQKLLESELDQLKYFLSHLNLKTSRKEIHDLRVLSRRLRAVFGVLTGLEKNEMTVTFLKKLKLLTRILGPVRSCDVSDKIFKLKLNPEAMEKAKSLAFVTGHFKKKRKDLRRQLLKDIRKAGISKFTQVKLRKKIMVKPDVSLLEKVLERKVQKTSMNLLKSWRQFCQKTRLSRLHEVRIDLKKWRYLLEIQDQCMGLNVKEVTERLGVLQEHLGDIHDLEVLLHHLSHRKCHREASQHKLKREWAAFLDHLETEIERKVTDFYNEGENYLVQLLPLRSL